MGQKIKIKTTLISRLEGLKQSLEDLKLLKGIDERSKQIIENELHDAIIYLKALEDDLEVDYDHIDHKSLKLEGW
jgi:hypothetical protein